MNQAPSRGTPRSRGSKMHGAAPGPETNRARQCLRHPGADRSLALPPVNEWNPHQLHTQKPNMNTTIDQLRSPGRAILGQIVLWTARVLSLPIILVVGFEMAVRAVSLRHSARPGHNYRHELYAPLCGHPLFGLRNQGGCAGNAIGDHAHSGVFLGRGGAGGANRPSLITLPAWRQKMAARQKSKFLSVPEAAQI